MDPLASGESRQVCSTFHNAAEKWYLMWPEKWSDQICAERSQNAYMTQTVFYDSGSQQERVPVLTIWYRRQRQMCIRDRDSTVSGIYGYTVPEQGERLNTILSEETVRSLFHTIEISWKSEDY